MNRRWVGKLIKTVILLVSFVVVFYKIKEFYQNSAGELSELLIPGNGMIILLIAALMCLNWLLEAVKWKWLVSGIQNITLFHSIHSVLIGITAGLLTPKRLGEVGGRIVLLKRDNQLKGIPAFGLGSIIQTSVTAFFGIIAGLVLIIKYSTLELQNLNLFLIIVGILLLMLLFLIFNLPLTVKWVLRIPWLKNYAHLFNNLASQSREKTFWLLVVGMMRYITFSIQFFLLIRLFDQSADIVESAIGIGLTYFILTFLPLSSLVELGVRGSVAGFVFGLFTVQAGSGVLAVLSLWIINLAIPAIFGAFVVYHSEHIEMELSSLKQLFRTKTST
ncbi:MAG: lysylphosphatidylglycerol synthase domain-containing protein [Bacteroidota bacterium]